MTFRMAPIDAPTGIPNNVLNDVPNIATDVFSSNYYQEIVHYISLNQMLLYALLKGFCESNLFWIRALNADWLILTSVPYFSHTYCQHRIQNKPLWRHNGLVASLYTRPFFIQKCLWSPYRQKSPNRHPDHKPNAGFPKDDSCVIWTQSFENCRLWCILNEKFTN